MSLETDLYTTLAAVCPRVYPDFAPVEAARPFVTWSIIGGQSIKPLGKSVPNRRHSLVQINVWAATRIEANSVMQQIDAALRQATVFDALPSSEMMTVVDEETTLRGSIQDFDIVGYR